MCGEPTIAAFALRALQPMLAPRAPLSLRCLSLRLLCDVWLCYGRGWARVEASLNG